MWHHLKNPKHFQECSNVYQACSFQLECTCFTGIAARVTVESGYSLCKCSGDIYKFEFLPIFTISKAIFNLRKHGTTIVIFIYINIYIYIYIYTYICNEKCISMFGLPVPCEDVH